MKYRLHTDNPTLDETLLPLSLEESWTFALDRPEDGNRDEPAATGSGRVIHTHSVTVPAMTLKEWEAWLDAFLAPRSKQRA